MGDGLDDDNSRGGEGAFALASVFFFILPNNSKKI
jgi:hypothetical protein